MSNCYKNIIKNFANKLNESNPPCADSKPEEPVELTQAKALHFDYETRRLHPNANPPPTVELENGKKLKFVSSLADQVKGKVDDAEDYEDISVYVDDSNKKYIVYDWDELTYGPIARLGAQSWTKRFESGALPPDAISPYWYDIINSYNSTLKFLDSNAAETIAKAIASLKLDAKQAKQIAEAICGNDTSFVDIMREVVVDNNLEHEFLTSDTDDFHDTIKGYEDKPIGALRYEFEV